MVEAATIAIAMVETTAVDTAIVEATATTPVHVLRLLTSSITQYAHIVALRLGLFSTAEYRARS